MSICMFQGATKGSGVGRGGLGEGKWMVIERDSRRSGMGWMLETHWPVVVWAKMRAFSVQ
jgi:hypothetical protein